MEIHASELSNITIPDKHDLDSPMLEIFIAIDIIFLILCLIGNSIVIHAILKSEILNSPSFMFIISVAAAHLFVGMCVLPMFIVSHFPEDHMTSFLCKFMMYITKVSTTSSSLSLMPMTIDSYRRYSPSINKPIRFKDAYLQITIVWVISLLYASWVPVMHDKVNEIHYTGEGYVLVQMCEVARDQHEMFKLHIIIDFVFMYCLPLLTMTMLYLRIFWWIWWHIECIANTAANRMRRMVTCSGLILAISFGLFGFGNYGMLYRIFWGPGYFPKAFVLRDVFSLLSFSLSWINVVLLFAFNPTFRQVIFIKVCKKHNTDVESNDNKVSPTAPKSNNTGSILLEAKVTQDGSDPGLRIRPIDEKNTAPKPIACIVDTGFRGTDAVV